MACYIQRRRTQVVWITSSKRASCGRGPVHDICMCNIGFCVAPVACTGPRGGGGGEPQLTCTRARAHTHTHIKGWGKRSEALRHAVTFASGLVPFRLRGSVGRTVQRYSRRASHSSRDPLFAASPPRPPRRGPLLLLRRDARPSLVTPYSIRGTALLSTTPWKQAHHTRETGGRRALAASSQRHAIALPPEPLSMRRMRPRT